MREVVKAVGAGLFFAALAIPVFAAWDGFHPDWSGATSHAAIAGVCGGLGVFFSEDRDLDEPEPDRHAWVLPTASWLVFLATGIWALTGAEVPNLAIFALTVSAVFVIGHLFAVVRRRRDERDELGL